MGCGKSNLLRKNFKFKIANKCVSGKYLFTVFLKFIVFFLNSGQLIASFLSAITYILFLIPLLLLHLLLPLLLLLLLFMLLLLLLLPGNEKVSSE